MSPSTRAPLYLAVALGTLLATGPLVAEPNSAATSYTNAKYGFSLAVPGDVFKLVETRNSQDGQLWESRDGQGRLLAVAATNASSETPTSYRSFVMQQSYGGATFDYTPIRDNWFVLSGRMADGRLFYERITFACEGRYIYGWQMTYPAAEKQRYDRIVEQIHRSFRAGRGEDGKCGRQARDRT